MKRCIKCLIPDTRPDTHFEWGMCSACRAYAARPEVDWGARMKSLLDLLERHGGRCIVPSSGGKDSTYQVMQLKELGAKPLVVTAATCHLTPIGRANIENLARHADLIEYTPDRSVRAKLNRLGLEMVGDISWPEHVAIFTTPFRIAVATGYKLLFYGENPQNQYGGPPGSEEAQQMTQRWVQEFGGFNGLRASDLVYQTSHEAMLPYTPPAPEQLRDVEAHFLGQYIPWDSHRNAEVAIRAGMRYPEGGPTPANWWPWENLDNAQTGLHDYMMYRKYGYGRGCAQISTDVRAGRISRPQALAWLCRMDGLFPSAYAGVSIEEVLDRIEVSRPRLIEIIDQFTNPDLFHKSSLRADRVTPFLNLMENGEP